MTAAELGLNATYEIPKGTSLGKYEILRKLATGGMAEIYLARVRGTAGFEKLVVLKRILPSVAEDPTIVRMFLDEARLAATLQHPNIADVYDVGEHAGIYFFTMEFIHGVDARAVRHQARARKELVPLGVSMSIIHGTASALDYAHDKVGPNGPLGLVHRDVSSSNILVSYDGAVKLVDFGIARATAQQQHTRTGTLKGKIPYMSPEQCRGHALDRRSDLWSLGVVMFELTVGKRPFGGTNDFEMMTAIVNSDPPRPSSLVAGYPPAMEAIVLRLLSRDPAQRYQTADELIDALEAIIAMQGLVVSAKPVARYMRAAFADKIAAWESAAVQGQTLATHVAETITGDSRRVDLLTPPSAVSRISDAHVAVRADPTPTPRPAPRADTQAVTGEALALVEPPRPSPVEPVAEPVLPTLRRGRGARFAILAVVALALGGVGAYALSYALAGKHKAEGPAPTIKLAPQPAEVDKPVTDKPAVVDKPVVDKPAVVDKPVADKPVAVDKPVVVDKPKPPVEPVKHNPVTPTPTPKPTPRPTPKPKDQPWDPNSPFLPPS